MSKIDFVAIAERALENANAVVEWLELEGEQSGITLTALNPTRDDYELGSFKINLENGRWADFACGDEAKGGDLISLAAYVLGMSQRKAAGLLKLFLDQVESGTATDSLPTAKEMLDTETGTLEKPAAMPDRSARKAKRKVVNSSEAIHPVPSCAPAAPTAFGSLGKPSMTFTYRDQIGQMLGYILRFDLADGKKEIRPLTYRRFSDGSERWVFSGFTQPFPLYGLDTLAKRPKDPVLVVEGEKAADAATRLLPMFVVVTTMHGAQSVDKADLQPLVGRDVTVWRDYDSAGLGYENNLITSLAELRGKTLISTINVPEMLKELCTMKEWSFEDKNETLVGWDAADVEALGIDADLIRPIIMASRNKVELPVEPVVCELDSGERFILSDEDGVVQIKQNKAGEYLVKVCSPLRFLGLGRDGDRMAWSLLAEVKTPDQQWHRFSMQKSMLTEMRDVKQEFLDRGCFIYNHDGFATLLNGISPPGRYLVARRCGWFEGRYLLGETVVGEKEAESVMLMIEGTPRVAYAQKQTSTMWNDTIGRYCVGNSRAGFVVSFALAAPLLQILGMENGGVHFVGESSIGKTTLLKIGASIYGEPGKLVTSWRATSNALESIAESRNDGVLFIDEMGQASPHEAGETVYMLGNGKGKGRATSKATLARQREWRLLFVSTGEIPLADHIGSVGKQVRAGMEIRLLNIPANAGQGHGIYENLHGFENGIGLASHLNTAVNTTHGSPGLAWIEYLIGQVESNPNLKSELLAELRGLQDGLYPERSEPQICRAAERFALIALAGEMASRAGILDWSAGTATAAIKTCFTAWLDQRGGIGSGEELTAFRQVQQYFQRYGESRFQGFRNGMEGSEPDMSRTIVDRAGYKRDLPDGSMVFEVFPATFRDQICHGQDMKLVISILEKRGLLVRGSGKDLTKVVRIPGQDRTMRVYVVKGEILGVAFTDEQDQTQGQEEENSQQPEALAHGYAL